jgi:hypothetical protein
MGEVSVEASDLPQCLSEASQENEHYTAQSGKIILNSAPSEGPDCQTDSRQNVI